MLLSYNKQQNDKLIETEENVPGFCHYILITFNFGASNEPIMGGYSCVRFAIVDCLPFRKGQLIIFNI